MNDRHRRRGGFTLTEVLVVMAIIGMLLGVAVSAYTSTGRSERRAARGEILSMLARARSHAIASGRPTALAVIGLSEGPVAKRGKALALFEVRRGVAGEGWEAGEQLRRWLPLPGGTVLLDGALAPKAGRKGSNVLDEPERLEADLRGQGSPGEGRQPVKLPFVVFAPTGAVVHPPGSGRVEFVVGEGFWGAGSLTVTARTSTGEPVVDRVVLSRLTGRAQSVTSREE